MSKATHSNVPTHLGIIVDGNRRWARRRGLPTLHGHRKGYERIKDLGIYAIDKGVKYVSAFIFSTENWSRSEDEISYLMDLAYERAVNDVDELNEKGIRIRWLGSRDRIGSKLKKAIERAEADTAHNTRGHLLLCFNYGGHLEIADAFKSMAQAGVKPEDITPNTITEHLYAPDVPPIDLMIRTSGEQRISNFMLWRVAYAELYFAKKHFPDFGNKDLDEALVDFANRDRRFGGDSKAKQTVQAKQQTAK